ncbi:hypothetical protein PAXINDRAFT_14209 [Paxillus involutus ATCC 200175]|uniref:Uncharacterized protein n=1 Tax=Paxillus involutus ATCC 200175 TaxID=664439 RepID=A0A0C9TBN4_PAXIN|nr:hypothetical protein PAXINDRAFT_14209 [Paxillus involutus ATCC 200175]
MDADEVKLASEGCCGQHFYVAQRLLSTQTLACCLQLMVTTRKQNQQAHPGYPDLPSPRQPQGKLKAKVAKAELQKKQELAIKKVATVEDKLLTDQQSNRANARQPPGPGVVKKLCAKAASTSSQSKSLVGITKSKATSATRLCRPAEDAAGENKDMDRDNEGDSKDDARGDGQDVDIDVAEGDEMEFDKQLYSIQSGARIECKGLKSLSPQVLSLTARAYGGLADKDKDKDKWAPNANEIMHAQPDETDRQMDVNPPSPLHSILSVQLSLQLLHISRMPKP